MKRMTYAVAALLLAAGCKREPMPSTTRTTGAAEPQPAVQPAPLTSKDKDFLNKAAQGGMLEVALGKEVSRKAVTPDVRSFAQQMVTDHGKADDELKQLAQSKGFDLATDLDKDHQSMVDKFAKLSGKKVDKDYASDMVDDHEDDVKEFQKAAKDLNDPDLRAWAAKTLPTLQHHLEMAKGIKNKTK